MKRVPRLLVCGGRNYRDKYKLWNVLDEICRDRKWTDNPGEGEYLNLVTLVCGMARGADTLAHDWAVHNYCEIEEYPAEWDKYGKSAGYIRNKRMADSRPDLVVAFPGGAGTANMVKIAREAGIEVIEVEE
jgi:hypothetical protein